VPWDLACERNWLSIERSVLTAEEKSAEGIVGDGQATLMRHSKAEKRSERIVEPQRRSPKARTVPREGIKREG